MDGCGSNPENMYGRTLQLYREYSRNAIVQIRNKFPVGFWGAGEPVALLPFALRQKTMRRHEMAMAPAEMAAWREDGRRQALMKLRRGRTSE
jgi:hypothetical protein